MTEFKDPKDMTPQELIERVNLYQSTDHVFYLVCSLGSAHGKLMPVERDGEVVLTCPGCAHVEREIPAVVFSQTVDILHRAQIFQTPKRG